MRAKHLIQIARGCERLSVVEKDGATYAGEKKRGGVGIVVWGDGTIQRTDVPFSGQYARGMRVYEAARLLGLAPSNL